MAPALNRWLLALSLVGLECGCWLPACVGAASVAATNSSSVFVTPVRITLGRFQSFTNAALGIIEPYQTNGLRLWSLRGTLARGRLGSAVASAGDWNRDGFADVLISERLTATQSAGQMLLYTGRVGGLTLAAIATPNDPQARSEYGQDVTSVGDVNGDGRPDVLVGAPRYTGRAATEAGRVFLYFSADSMERAKPEWFVQGDAGGGRFGCSVSAGDVNADGFVDVFVGARAGRRSGHRFGDAFAFYGSSNGLPREPSWVASGTQRNGEFGARVAVAGDVNGDGFADVLVGEGNRRDAESNIVGRIVLYLGGKGGLGRAPDWEFSATPPHTGGVGESLCAAGDLNRDGFADFALGAPENKILRDYPGRTLLFYGRKRDLGTNAHTVLIGESAQDLFGTALAGGGDFNGDGFSDLLVSAPRRSATHRNEGRIYLFRGGPNGLERSPVCTIDGGHTEMLAGRSLAFAGDVDRDGTDDIVIGSPGYDANPPVDAGRVDIVFGSRTLFVPVTNSSPTLIHPPPKVVFAASPELRSRIKLGIIIGLAVTGATLAAIWYSGHLRQRRLVKAEQARIARDLHDDLGAQIALLSGNDDVSARAARLALNRAIFELDAERHTLDTFVTFLGDYAEDAFKDTGIRCLHDVPHVVVPRPLKPEVCKAVLLCFKETVSNVLKHAQATQVWLRITVGDSQLQLTVEDNGVGCEGVNAQGDPRTATGKRATGGNGLINLRERMTEIGGSFSIESRPEGGTRVTFTTVL